MGGTLSRSASQPIVNKAPRGAHDMNDGKSNASPGLTSLLVYWRRPETLILDSARRSPIEAQRSERGSPFPIGKGDEAAESRKRSLNGPLSRGADEQSESARRDRLGKVAASPKSKFQADASINPHEKDIAEVGQELSR
jgi:hypothetical protein